MVMLGRYKYARLAFELIDILWTFTYYLMRSNWYPSIIRSSHLNTNVTLCSQTFITIKLNVFSPHAVMPSVSDLCTKSGHTHTFANYWLVQGANPEKSMSQNSGFDFKFEKKEFLSDSLDRKWVTCETLEHFQTKQSRFDIFYIFSHFECPKSKTMFLKKKSEWIPTCRIWLKIWKTLKIAVCYIFCEGEK